MQRTFFERYGFRILVLVVFSLAFIWMGTRHTLESNSNNVADWLPKQYPQAVEYRWFLDYFPYESFVIISWKGCTLSDSRVEMFAQKLVPSETIDNISSWMINAHQLEAELDTNSVNSNTNLNSNKPPANSINQPNTANQSSTAARPQYFKHVLTGPRLIRMLEDRYSDKSSPIYLSRAQIIDRLKGTLVSPIRTAEDGTALEESQYQTALMVTLDKQYSGKELKKVLSTIREIGDECGLRLNNPNADLSLAEIAFNGVVGFFKEIIYGREVYMDGVILGGPPVDNVAIDYEGQRTLVRLAGICAVMGFVISYLCLRSLRLTCFVFWASILSAGLAMALVTFTGSRCDAILLSMPALVYVLTLSSAIHIINYYHDVIREQGLSGAAEKAVSHAWYPCFVAQLTTAFGLFSLYFAGLLPIIKFGIYAGIGVLGSLCFLFLYLPALLHHYPSRDFAEKFGGKGLKAEQNSVIYKFWQWFGAIIINNNKKVVVLCLIFMFGFGYGIFQIKSSVKLMRFFSADSEIIQHYTWLEDKLGPLVPMEVVLRFDNTKLALAPQDTKSSEANVPAANSVTGGENDNNDNANVPQKNTQQIPVFNTLDRLRLVSQVNQLLEKSLPEDIGGLMSAATMAPPLGKPPTPGIRKTPRQTARDSALNSGLDNARLSLKDYVMFEGNPSFKVDSPTLTHDLDEIGMTNDEAKKLRAIGCESLRDMLNMPEGKAAPGLTVAEIDSIREKCKQWQRLYGHDLWRINLRVWSLKRDIDYAILIDNIETMVTPFVNKYMEERGFSTDGVEVRYTGMVKLVYKTQYELLYGLELSLLTAFVTIMIVMMFVLRSVMAGFLAMLPNIFPVAIVFGFMGLAGILVDVGTMMTASVGLGIAVDDTIHFLTWFRAGIDRGLNAKEAAYDAYERCATAMTQTLLIGGLGLSSFAFSTFTPTQMFGIMMITLLTVSEIGDLVFLPAILTGPAGKYFMPKKKKGKVEAETKEDSSQL
ncbi:MAG: MMPL family transporter [Planctomycetaceae bacterium]|jgi:predicted RND superfamily exporter protein|nr:MMPL family transporter [Planctomycetaceae bacterium]